MAKLTIIAEIDLNNGDEASDLLSSITGVLLDMADECNHGYARRIAKSGVIKNDEEDEDEDPFGTWKWE